MTENKYKLKMVRDTLDQIDGPAGIGEVYFDGEMAKSDSNRMRVLFENQMASNKFCTLLAKNNRGVSLVQNTLSEEDRNCRITRTGRKARHIVSITFPWVTEEEKA